MMLKIAQSEWVAHSGAPKAVELQAPIFWNLTHQAVQPLDLEVELSSRTVMHSARATHQLIAYVPLLPFSCTDLCRELLLGALGRRRRRGGKVGEKLVDICHRLGEVLEDIASILWFGGLVEFGLGAYSLLSKETTSTAV